MLTPRTTSEAIPSDVGAGARASSGEEGCPTPLAWQEVLTSVRQESERHQVEYGTATLKATRFGTGRPLYLLPGFLGDHELFALTAWLLREECCCVLIDPPSFGPGERGKARETLAGWAGGVTRLAEELGHRDLHLHGPNFGGLLAMQTMLDYPELVRSASLQCAFPRWSPTLAERFLTTVGRFSNRTIGSVAAIRRIQEQNHRHWFPPFDVTRWEYYRENISSTEVADASLRAQLAASIDLAGELHRIEQPVLIIRTEGDGQAITQSQTELLSVFRNVRCADLDNCGRLPHVTHPHRLVKLLRNFWNETA